MRSAFDAALTKLMATIDGLRNESFTPAPPPDNNGAAYEKFVTMLAKLSEGRSSETLDTSA